MSGARTCAQPPRSTTLLTALLSVVMAFTFCVGILAPTGPAAAATADISGFVITPSAAFAHAPITAATGRLPVDQLKGVNYYPSAAPWTHMWSQYNHAVVDADFTKMSQLGANSVRVIIQPSAVGFATVNPTGAAQIRDVVDTAAAHGLAVALTLFDWYSGYDQLRFSTQWLTSVLAPYKNDNRIALVGLQNEVVVSNPVAIIWARTMLALLPALVPGVPRTLSIADGQNSADFVSLTNQIGPDLLDVIAVHLYGSENSIIAKLASANAVAAGRPVIVGELGMATDQWNTACSQSIQLSFYQRAALAMARAGVSAMMPWTLNDFAQSGMPAVYPPGAPEERFGLRSLSGYWKFAASGVTAMFAATTPADELARLSASNISSLSFDGGFNCDLRAVSDNTGKDSWMVFDVGDTTGAGAAAGAGVNGTYAGYLRGTSGSPTTKIPSLMHSFPSLSTRPITVTALTRLVAGTGTTNLTLAWYSASGVYLGQNSSVAANNSTTGWQTLNVVATPKPGATLFQVHLKSLDNNGTAYFDNVTLSN